MSRNPHSEFLTYHGFAPDDTGNIPRHDIDLLKAADLDNKFIMQQVLPALRTHNTYNDTHLSKASQLTQLIDNIEHR